MSASDMNFLEQLKITMANLMGIDDDSQNKKKCFFEKNMIRSKEMMQLKFKKGSHERYCGCQWIRFQFCNVSMIGSLSQNPQLHIRRHVQINQSCVISASLRMFHFGWIFVFFTQSREEISTVWLTYSNFMHLEFGRGHVNSKRTRDNKF